MIFYLLLLLNITYTVIFLIFTLGSHVARLIVLQHHVTSLSNFWRMMETDDVDQQSEILLPIKMHAHTDDAQIQLQAYDVYMKNGLKSVDILNLPSYDVVSYRTLIKTDIYQVKVYCGYCKHLAVLKYVPVCYCLFKCNFYTSVRYKYLQTNIQCHSKVCLWEFFKLYSNNLINKKCRCTASSGVYSIFWWGQSWTKLQTKIRGRTSKFSEGLGGGFFCKILIM